MYTDTGKAGGVDVEVEEVFGVGMVKVVGR
jgi:hypothetical protein